MQRKLDEIMNRLDQRPSGSTDPDHGHGEDSLTSVPAYPEWSVPRMAEQAMYSLSSMSCSGFSPNHWRPGPSGYFIDPDAWHMDGDQILSRRKAADKKRRGRSK